MEDIYEQIIKKKKKIVGIFDIGGIIGGIAMIFCVTFFAGSLAFSNLLASDEGVYKCFARSGTGLHGAGCVKLTVEPSRCIKNYL